MPIHQTIWLKSPGFPIIKHSLSFHILPAGVQIKTPNGFWDKIIAVCTEILTMFRIPKLSPLVFNSAIT